MISFQQYGTFPYKQGRQNILFSCNLYLCNSKCHEADLPDFEIRNTKYIGYISSRIFQQNISFTFGERGRDLCSQEMDIYSGILFVKTYKNTFP